jgi:hypothetical protein
MFWNNAWGKPSGLEGRRERWRGRIKDLKRDMLETA